LKCRLKPVVEILRDVEEIKERCPFLRDELEFLETVSRCYDPQKIEACICDPSKGACEKIPMCHDGRLRSIGIFDLLLVKRRRYCEVELKLGVKSREKVKDHVSASLEKFSTPCCDYSDVREVMRVIVFRDPETAGKARSHLDEMRPRYRVLILALSEACRCLR
jgi:hypothetical protein